MATKEIEEELEAAQDAIASQDRTPEPEETASEEYDFSEDLKGLEGFEEEEETSALEEEDSEEASVEEDDAEETSVEEEVSSSEDSDESPEDLSREELLSMLLSSQEELAKLREGKPSEDSEEGSSETTEDKGETLKVAAENARSMLENQYQLSKEDADKVLTAPEEVLPRIAAELHLQVLTSLASVVRNMLPGMMAEFHSARQEDESFISQVLGFNEKLKGREAEIRRAKEMYRRLNPKASQEELARRAAAIVSLGDKAQEKPKETGKVVRKASAPHRPAASRARQAAPKKRVPQNEFEEMALQDFE